MEVPKLQNRAQLDRYTIDLVESWPKKFTGNYDSRGRKLYDWLSGEAKIAWRRIYEDIAYGKFGTFKVAPAFLAAKQNRDERCADEWLKRLDHHGLIRIKDRGDNIWIFEFFDPTEAVRARLAQEGDGQGELFERHDAPDDDAEEPQILQVGRTANGGHSTSSGLPPAVTSAEPGDGFLEVPGEPAQNPPQVPAQDPPQVPAQDPPQVPAHLDLRPNAESFYKTSDFSGTKQEVLGREEVKGQEVRRGGTCAASADGVKSIGAIVGLTAAALAAVPTDPILQIEMNQRFSAWLRKQVPGLYQEIADEISQAVGSGDFEAQYVEKLLRSLEKAKRKGLRVGEGAYFAKSYRKCRLENDPRTK